MVVLCKIEGACSTVNLDKMDMVVIEQKQILSETSMGDIAKPAYCLSAGFAGNRDLFVQLTPLLCNISERNSALDILEPLLCAICNAFNDGKRVFDLRDRFNDLKTVDVYHIVIQGGAHDFIR